MGRTVSATALCVCFPLVAACGGTSEGSGAVEAAMPEVSFAPLVLLDPDERYRPMSAEWFIERSVLWFAEDQGCADRKVAVGRTLPEQRTEASNWIGHSLIGSGGGWSYYRSPHDARCEQNHELRAYADQHVRPHDSENRPPGIRSGEGFYLDLVDSQRGGPKDLGRVATYVERIDGEPETLRLAYWMLFGMHAPPGRPGETHEGDWERLDVLLRREGNSRYKPLALLLGAIDHEGAPATPARVPWSKVRSVNGAHPLLVAERGSHTLTPARSRGCLGCERWRTWNRLEPVRKRDWHGFGGAWGGVGRTGATTGPLGPHGAWRTEVRD